MSSFNQILIGLGQIPFESVLNIIFLIVIFTLIFLNPTKPKLRDMINWWKLKMYKNPSIHRIIFPNSDEQEFIINNFGDKLDGKYLGDDKCTYIMNQQKATRRNKVPVFTHHVNKAQGVDYFNSKEAEKLDAEKYYNIIHNAKINVDVIRELLKKKDLIKYIIIGVICMGAAALFSFQGLNVANTIIERLDTGKLVCNCASAVVELATK